MKIKPVRQYEERFNRLPGRGTEYVQCHILTAEITQEDLRLGPVSSSPSLTASAWRLNEVTFKRGLTHKTRSEHQTEGRYLYIWRTQQVARA